MVKSISILNLFNIYIYSTVTDLSKFLGLLTSKPLILDAWQASNCIVTTAIILANISSTFGIYITLSDDFSTSAFPSCIIAILLAY